MKNLTQANREINKWCGTKDVVYYKGIEALGFLFQYAVPKLSERIRFKFLLEWIIDIDGKDPALALFWVINKVMETK